MQHKTLQYIEWAMLNILIYSIVPPDEIQIVIHKKIHNIRM